MKRFLTIALAMQVAACVSNPPAPPPEREPAPEWVVEAPKVEVAPYHRSNDIVQYSGAVQYMLEGTYDLPAVLHTRPARSQVSQRHSCPLR